MKRIGNELQVRGKGFGGRGATLYSRIEKRVSRINRASNFEFRVSILAQALNERSHSLNPFRVDESNGLGADDGDIRLAF